MSASLVGSEMCIRDRVWCTSEHFGAFSIAEELFGAVWTLSSSLEHFRAPVSYTHLTLPTICSV
eukprot:10288214-Alexandrium_andersonii.AAC.1